MHTNNVSIKSALQECFPGNRLGIIELVYKKRILWFLFGLVFLVGLALSYQAWIMSSNSIVEVKWTTASELDTAGFNLYRSDQGEENFIQINSSLIPASNDPLTGGSYSYTDRTVEAGRTYYYELEDVEINGTKSRVGRLTIQAEVAGKNERIASLALMVVGLIGLLGMLLQSQRRSQSSGTEDDEHRQ